MNFDHKSFSSLNLKMQYPHEKEILIPPVTGLEVLRDPIEEPDGALVYDMGLNVNLRCMTIEEVLNHLTLF